MTDNNYPRMLFDKNYKSHCDVSDHDRDRARRKEASMIKAINPDDLETKLALGYREHPDDFDEAESPAPVATEPAEAPVVEERPSRRRRAVESETPPEIE